MKFKNLVILSLFFLCFLILFFCKSETEAPELQSREEIIERITFSEELKAELSNEDMIKHKDNLAETTERFRDNLIDLFNPENGDRNYEEMGVLLGQRRAILEDSRTDYTSLYGSLEIAGLFKNLSKGRLELEIRHVFIDKIFDPRTEDGEEVNMIARIFFKYRVPRVEEGMLENQAGGGSYECLHRHNCPWCNF